MFIRFIYGRLIRLSKILSRKNLYNWLCDELSRYGQEIKVLNIGSGGDLERILSRYSNFDLINIDIDQKREPGIVMDACNLGFLNNSYDLVILFEVLEHIKTPQQAVDEIYRVLKPGGKVIITTPFVFGIHDEPYDYYRYTKYGLLHLLRNYEDVSVRERNGYISTVNVLLVRLIKAKQVTDKIIGSFLMFFIMLLYPVFIFGDLLVRNKNITTGYFTLASKPILDSSKVKYARD